MLIVPYHQRIAKNIALPIVLHTIDIIIHLNLLECVYSMKIDFIIFPTTHAYTIANF
jgi:hypothetical protein